MGADKNLSRMICFLIKKPPRRREKRALKVSKLFGRGLQNIVFHAKDFFLSFTFLSRSCGQKNFLKLVKDLQMKREKLCTFSCNKYGQLLRGDNTLKISRKLLSFPPQMCIFYLGMQEMIIHRVCRGLAFPLHLSRKTDRNMSFFQHWTQQLMLLLA